ncbi:cholesterol 25-hydroxylase-like protein 1, member 2 [Tubulanus polymorphus]|uniref:cholesterol 25-hydroxylase-like protein 1, member 2 n=1 Tax=Tubulanus polymorphus TaxID=672921 RepID=UPI003DA4FCD7
MENITETFREAVAYNPLQTLWDLRFGWEDVLRSPLWPVLSSVTFYFICILPFTVVDLYGKNWQWIQKYKIQPEKEVTAPLVMKAVIQTAWNQVLYILPATIAQYLWTPPTPLPPTAPSMWEFTWQMIAMLIIFDFQYFVWHMMHHKSRFLYKCFHSLHHQYNSPFSWVTQYLHPWELITVGFFTTVNPWIFKCHPLTTWIWNYLNIVISVEAHHGFDFPFGGHKWIPFGLWGGAIQHDMHHMKPMTNFQPYMTHWDRLFKSYWPGTRAGGYKSEELLKFERVHRERRSAKNSITNGRKID